MRLLKSIPLPLLACVAIGSAAVAQTIDTDATAIPYSGYLEVDGVPANGAFDVSVGLFPVPTGGTACDTVAISDVNVDGGQFQVLLDDVSDSCFSGAPLYLEVGVAAVGEPPVVFGSRQLVGSVPFAAAGSPNGEMFSEALHSKRLLIQTDDTDASGLTPGMSLVVTGTMGSGLASDGAIEFRHDNQTQGIGFGFNTIYATGSNPNQELNLTARGNSTMTLNGASSGAVNVSSSLNVAGNVGVTNNLNVSGTVTRSFRDCPSGMNRYTSPNGRARLCVQRLATSGDWSDAVRNCWTTTGSDLCTMSQLRIATSQGLTPVVNYYLADRFADDSVLVTNGTGLENFDGTSGTTVVRTGGYCCLMLTQ